MAAYYNEIEPFAAQWLRNLIQAGHIADGVVDERSIEDVHPNDLRDFTQCHFFAGIGVWSHALRNAGWTDDRPVWTGSCPCQPFSAAGAGAGFADERHLWPAFFHLIQECRPAAVFGEQVASKDAEPWIDLVRDDLESLGYAVGAVPFPAAGVGAPHIRDRLYWVANTTDKRQHGRRPSEACNGRDAPRFKPERFCDAGRLADNSGTRLEKRKRLEGVSGQPPAAIKGQATERGSLCTTGGLANNDCDRCQPWREGGEAVGHGETAGADCGACFERPSPLHGFWRDADWLLCRDGKWRPVEPGTFPLAHGTPARVGRLRAYGNAIVGPQAQAFIEAVMEVTA